MIANNSETEISLSEVEGQVEIEPNSVNDEIVIQLRDDVHRIGLKQYKDAQLSVWMLMSISNCLAVILVVISVFDYAQSSDDLYSPVWLSFLITSSLCMFFLATLLYTNKASTKVSRYFFLIYGGYFSLAAYLYHQQLRLQYSTAITASLFGFLNYYYPRGDGSDKNGSVYLVNILFVVFGPLIAYKVDGGLSNSSWITTLSLQELLIVSYPILCVFLFRKSFGYYRFQGFFHYLTIGHLYIALLNLGIFMFSSVLVLRRVYLQNCTFWALAVAVYWFILNGFFVGGCQKYLLVNELYGNKPKQDSETPNVRDQIQQ